ncbi:MAG: flagellar biosynthetic protein FliR [Oscillospiraceae bacterium]|jgi:flagellar biosynthetic protein FliR|nr:flagellar biosynthetic protein FliR [Oscillospiraceae bacterium]
MSETVNSIVANADYFVLLLFRVSGLIFSSPVFGRNIIPARAKIGFIAALTFLFFTAVPPSGVIEYNSLFGFALIGIGELMTGIALAFVTNMFFSLTFVAGQLVDMQIGYGIANVYDPQNNTQIPMMGNLFNTAVIISFFAVNGHQRLIEIVYLTLRRLPVGGVGLSPQIGLAALEIFSLTFMLGVMVATPIIASALILEIAFGVIIRTVPQLNMFVVGVPVKMFVGLVTLMFMMPVFVNFSERIFSEMFSGIEKMFSAFVGAA